MTHILDHKQLIVRAVVKKPCVSEDHACDWLKRLVNEVDMKLILGPFAKYSTTPGNEGIAAICGIATSHASLQVWDKEDPPYLNFDLYSCQKFDIDKVLSLIYEFDPCYYHWKLIDRNNKLDVIDAGKKQVAKIIDFMGEKEREMYLLAEKTPANERTDEMKKARSVYAKLRRRYSLACVDWGHKAFHKHMWTLSTIKSRAKKKGLDFNLTPEWVDQAFVEAKKKYPKLTLRQRGESGFWTGDIDRIDSSKGYTIDNCRILPHSLNVAKWSWSQKELMELVPMLIEITEKASK
jgi:hypothetical protein